MAAGGTHARLFRGIGVLIAALVYTAGGLAATVTAGSQFGHIAIATIGPTSASPSEIVVDEPTPVTFTARISSPNLKKQTVLLLRIDDSGRPIDIVARLRDDGRKGDTTRHDGIYSVRVRLNEPAAGSTYFRIAARFEPALKFRGRHSDDDDDDWDDDLAGLNDHWTRHHRLPPMLRKLLRYTLSDPIEVTVKPLRIVVPGPHGKDLLLAPGSQHGLVFGPEKFSRERGKPRTIRREIFTEQFDAPFALYVRNGTADGRNRVSSAQIALDGTVLLDASNFANQEPGYIIPVVPAAGAVLDVSLPAGRGGEIAVWMAGNPVLMVERNDTFAASQVVSAEGATLTSVDADGTQYVLTIPPKALTEPREITITPIQSIPNLPLAGGFRYGVHFEPEGLQLIRAAHLEIRPLPTDLTGLVGFGYEGDGRGLQVLLSRTTLDTIEMPILHFSGAGVGEGTPEDVFQKQATATGDLSAGYEAQLAGFVRMFGLPLPDAVLWDVQRIFGDWFTVAVVPPLIAAFECGRTDCPTFQQSVHTAGNAYWRWREAMVSMQLVDNPALRAMNADYINSVAALFPGLIADLDKQCRDMGDFCHKQSHMQRMLLYANTVVLLEGLGEYNLDPAAMCGGAMSGVVDSVGIAPGRLTVPLKGATRAALIPTNKAGRVLTEVNGIEVTWEIGEPPLVRATTVTGKPLEADVHGDTLGTTYLGGVAVQCPANTGTPPVRFEVVAPVDVVSPIASVVVTPTDLVMEIGDAQIVTVGAVDPNGQPVPPGDYLVEFPPSVPGVVGLTPHIDVVNNRWTVQVRGVAPGSVQVSVVVKQLNGTEVESVRGSFQVTVREAPSDPAASVTLDQTFIRLRKNDSARLVATIKNASGDVLDSSPVWTSDDVAIARISSSGSERASDGLLRFFAVIEAVGPGTVNIMATRDGISASASVRVTSALPDNTDPSQWILKGRLSSYRANWSHRISEEDERVDQIATGWYSRTREKWSGGLGGSAVYKGGYLESFDYGGTVTFAYERIDEMTCARWETAGRTRIYTFVESYTLLPEREEELERRHALDFYRVSTAWEDPQGRRFIRFKPPDPLYYRRSKVEHTVEYRCLADGSLSPTPIDLGVLETTVPVVVFSPLENHHVEMPMEAPYWSGDYDYPISGLQWMTKKSNKSLTVNLEILDEPIGVVSARISPYGADIGIGETIDLRVYFLDSEGWLAMYGEPLWTSSAPSVARFESDRSTFGVLQGVSTGIVTVTAENAGYRVSETITVGRRVAAVELSPPKITMRVFEDIRVSAIVRDNLGGTYTDGPVIWRSSNPLVAEVASSGWVRGKSVGVAEIIASYDGVESAPVPVTVLSRATAIRIEGTPPSLSVGGRAELVARLIDSDGTDFLDDATTWSSSNPAVIRVDVAAGAVARVTAVGAGTAMITAHFEGVEGNAMITVARPVASVDVLPASANIRVGEHVQLLAVVKDGLGNPFTDKPVTWSSSDSSVASVDANGKVTGERAGFAQIVASSDGVKSAPIPIEVTSAVSVVRIVTEYSRLVAGDSTQLYAVLTDSAGRDFSDPATSWSSSDETVAAVDGTGSNVTVRALRRGTATITARFDGVEGSIALSVVTIDSIAIEPDEKVTVRVGETVEFTAFITDSEGNRFASGDTIWSAETSEPDVLRLEQTPGSPVVAVSVLKVGKATITAEYRGVRASRVIGIFASDETFSISGRVSYSTTPLQGIRVDLGQGDTASPPLQTVQSGVDGSYAFSAVAPGLYWVKVYGGEGFVEWISVSVAIVDAPITQDLYLRKPISAISPAVGSIVDGLTPILSWTPNPEADAGGRYEISINTSSPWMVVETGTSAANTYAVQEPLTRGAAYTWMIEALDSGGRTVGTGSATFIVKPETGTHSISGRVHYSSTPLPGLTVSLHVGAPTEAAVQTVLSGGDGSFAFTALAAGQYFVRVNGGDEFISWIATTVDVSTDDVIQDMYLPKVIALLTPADGSSVSATHPLLTWTPNPEADAGGRYAIQINESATWAELEIGESAASHYTIQNALTPGIEYTWQVDAYDANQRHVGTTMFAFRVTVK